MRELGHRGGKARRKGVGEQLPDAARLSLRDVLREQLDHGKVKAAIEQSLAGGNESARVSAVKFLADLELYRKDGDECPVCAKRKGEAGDVRERLAALLNGRADRSRAARARGARMAREGRDGRALSDNELAGAELERAVAERTADLERERDEALARLQEFQTA
jgi:hypothetical protein